MGRTSVVVFPGLVKTANEEGRRYTELKVILQPEVLEL